MPPEPAVMAWAAGAFVVGVIGTLIWARIMGSSVLSRARRESAQIVSNAEREAASIQKEANTAIKEQQIELRAQIEEEAREQRKEVVALEKRVIAKEENLDKRLETLDQKTSEIASKEQSLAQRETELAKEKEQAAAVVADQMRKLEEISCMTAEDAKQALFAQLETAVKRDTAVRLKRMEDEMVETSEKKAKWVIAQAIQRCAADHVAESTVSVVDLPNDEMKGRIIGREGRNIPPWKAPPASTSSSTIPRKPLSCPGLTRCAARLPALPSNASSRTAGSTPPASRKS